MLKFGIKILAILTTFALITSQANCQTNKTINGNGFVFPNGQMMHGFFCFIPSQESSLEKELMKHDTIGYYIFYGPNCNFTPLDFDLYDTQNRKNGFQVARFKGTEGDSVITYRVKVELVYKTPIKYKHYNKFESGIEDEIEISGHQVKLYPITSNSDGQCKEVKIITSGN